MRSSLPPKVANWLLARFDVDEALIGDLVEEYGRDHSRAWFWRQTVVAVIKTGATDVHSHKLIAIRAVVIGWMVESLVGWTMKQFVIGGVYGLAFNSVFPFIVVPAGLMLGGLLSAQPHRGRSTRPMSTSA